MESLDPGFFYVQTSFQIPFTKAQEINYAKKKVFTSIKRHVESENGLFVF